MIQFQQHIDVDNLWNIILGEAQAVVDETPLLKAFYDRNILQHTSYNAALAHVLADKPENTLQWSEFFRFNDRA